MENEINESDLENLFEPMFESLKNLLLENIERELTKNIHEKSVEDFFNYLNIHDDVELFLESSDNEKVKDILSWFRAENWTLDLPVYDFTYDEFEFEIPKI